MRVTRLAMAAACLVLAARPLVAQEPPKPGPEHERLKKFEGNWDATVSFMGGESKGTSTWKVGVGGFWLFQHFKGDFGGLQFEGRGVSGYDPAKKKYVSTWVDSMNPTMTHMEGHFDKDGKRYTEVGEGVGPGGKQKMKSVAVFKDDNTIVFTMYAVQDGTDNEMMKITYRRKK